ncbi:uncharacterized protein LOC134719800 [Mytilus trossulus]|uniref:uncharacterized protein LOC134719800 n=1 Tax=Mytilus trossulus TaxID=6551 RepID=UPI003007240E
MMDSISEEVNQEEDIEESEELLGDTRLPSSSFLKYKQSTSGFTGHLISSSPYGGNMAGLYNFLSGLAANQDSWRLFMKGLSQVRCIELNNTYNLEENKPALLLTMSPATDAVNLSLRTACHLGSLLWSLVITSMVLVSSILT